MAVFNLEPTEDEQDADGGADWFFEGGVEENLPRALGIESEMQGER